MSKISLESLQTDQYLKFVRNILQVKGETKAIYLIVRLYGILTLFGFVAR